MTNEQLRATRRRLRDGHQQLFDTQGTTIVALKDAIEAVGHTHDEIATLMQAGNDLEGHTDENPDVSQ